MSDAEKLMVVIHSGDRVRVSAAQMQVIDALRACERKGMADVTRREVLELMVAQLGYEVREHVVSGRFSELVKLEVIEEAPKRDDRFTIAIRAKRGRASKVLAYRMRRPVQGWLALPSALPSQNHVIDGRAALAGGGSIL